MGYFKKIDFNMKGSGLLHNKALLYFIFAISFGNFIIELINGDSYFVVIYILIGCLTTFFSKNMIVVLSVAVIFANILKSGKGSVEGFEEGADGEDIIEGNNDDDADDEKKDENFTDTFTDSSNNSNSDITTENYSDRDLDNMNYKESEKMLENQKLLLQNMKEFKPFIDTIQNLAKSFVPPTIEDE